MSYVIACPLVTHLDRVKLDTGLDDINRGQSTVGDGTADTTGGGTLQVVHEIILGSGRGRSQQNLSRRSHDRSELLERWKEIWSEVQDSLDAAVETNNATAETIRRQEMNAAVRISLSWFGRRKDGSVISSKRSTPWLSAFSEGLFFKARRKKHAKPRWLLPKQMRGYEGTTKRVLFRRMRFRSSPKKHQ